MCGIAGLILPGQSIEPKWLEGLDRALSHRGPDDRGVLGWRDGELGQPSRDPIQASGSTAALVHRRLSILELSALGWQPMIGPDRRSAIVFNGEVYNFVELRLELEGFGHRFLGRSDAEIVLAAWKQWGFEAFSRFIGMFAIAILDLDRRQLILARDPFGIKPLYWARWREGIAFASEIPALLSLPGLGRSADPTAVYDYLCFGHTDRGTRTMFAEISRVPAGQTLTIGLDDAVVANQRPFWRLAPDTLDIGADDAAAELKRLFMESVKLHLRADVPIGIALSGGIDSSAILGTATAMGLARDIHAFSFISEDDTQSEEHWIDVMAKAAGIQVHKVKPQARELASELDDLIASQGEPFASTGMFAQYKVFELVRSKGIKVSLDGQGADEMLAGYPTYRAARLADLIGHGDPSALGLAVNWGAGTVLRAGAMLVPDWIVSRARQSTEHAPLPPWLDRNWLDRHAVRAVAPALNRRRSRLHDRLEQTLTDLSLPALLRYADRNSMAHSVESRTPFLTPQIAQFILSLPAKLLIDDHGNSKAVFRQAMRGMVPDAILDRRDKVGFSVPEARWLRDLAPRIESVLTDPELDLPMLHRDMAMNDYRETLSGRRPWSSRFWRWINLAAWARRFEVNF